MDSTAQRFVTSRPLCPLPECPAEKELDRVVLAATARSGESAWLIEFGESEPSRPAYWMGPSEDPAHWPFGLWADDNLKAVRFARCEDAEAVAKLIQINAGHDLRAQFRVAEHGWA